MQFKIPDKFANFPVSRMLSQIILRAKLIDVLVDNTGLFSENHPNSLPVFYQTEFLRMLFVARGPGLLSEISNLAVQS